MDGEADRFGARQTRAVGMVTPSVLLVEDDEALAVLLEYNLSKAGFRVERAATAETALGLIAEHTPDLVVLDWMLPQMSGLEACARLRAEAATRELPILMLTARTHESDRVAALDAGADDYLAKPFSNAELAARLRALLRRTRPELTEAVLAYGDLRFDREAMKVAWLGREMPLRGMELKVLEFLMLRPHRVFSREDLLDAIWGRDARVEARNVDVQLGRLRKSLEAVGACGLIRTVRGRGYALDSRQSA